MVASNDKTPKPAAKKPAVKKAAAKGTKRPAKEKPKPGSIEAILQGLDYASRYPAYGGDESDDDANDPVDESDS